MKHANGSGSWRDNRIPLRAAAGACGALLLLAACNGENLFRGDVSTIAPPTIAALTVPDSVVPNSDLGIQVEAVSLAGVARIDLALAGAVVADTLIQISPAQTDVVRSLTFSMPDSFQSSALVVTATAVDGNGVSSQPVTASVRAVTPP
jgi:hypothetical protein